MQANVAGIVFLSAGHGEIAYEGINKSSGITASCSIHCAFLHRILCMPSMKFDSFSRKVITRRHVFMPSTRACDPVGDAAS